MARLLQSDSDYSDEVLDPDTGRQRGRRQAASKPKRRPGETSAAAAARRRREQRCAPFCRQQLLSRHVSSLTALNRPQIARRRPWQNPDPTYYDEWRVDARDKFAGTSPTHSVPVALLSSCMTLALLFAAQLKEERELSGSEASLPSSRWDSADEDAGGPNPKLRPPLDLDAFDRATQPVGERKPRHLSDECAISFRLCRSAQRVEGGLKPE